MSASDEELVQYLDGQLSPERQREIDAALLVDSDLANRLASMDIDTQAVRETFDSVLTQAPEFAMASSAIGQTGLSGAADDQGVMQANNSTMPWLALAASVLLALAVGFGAARYLPGSDHTVHWHQAVVDYQQLYTTDTLPPDNPPETTVRAQLDAVSKTSGLRVTPDMVQLSGLTFKRAQTLGHDGKPLVQLVFTDRDGEPVALCFMPIQASAEPRAAQIDGMNTVSWANGRYSFVLVAHSDPSLLAQVAAQASQQF